MHEVLVGSLKRCEHDTLCCEMRLMKYVASASAGWRYADEARDVLASRCGSVTHIVLAVTFIAA